MGSIPLGTSNGDWRTGGSTIANLGSGSGRLQVTGSPQQTAQVQQTAPASYFQETYNPQNQVATPYYQAAGGGGGGGGGGNIQTAAQLAAQRAAQEAAQRAAEEEAQRQQIRGTIGGLIDQALGVYDTLYGNVRGAAQSQRKLLEDRYSKETGALTDQFNAELPKIGRAYAGRGAYDSSFREGSEATAGEGFKNQLGTLQTGYESDRAKVGQELMAQEANIGTQRSLLDLTRGKLGEVSDINELKNTQNDIQRRIAELQGQARTIGTQEAYSAKFGELAPAADRMATLQTQLTNIVKGSAPGQLKKMVAEQIIGSSGLPDEQKQQLTAQISQIVG